MTKLLLSIVFFLLSIYITTAQSNVQFERYTIENGLSSNKVSQVYQDSKGFIWVATRDGLNRYDGYHFQVFKNNPQDATSLPDNFVQHLFEDKNGTLWIGTEKGLSYYDHAQQCFFNIQVGKKNAQKYINVSFIYEDKSENLWVATNGTGLACYDRSNRTFRFFSADEKNPSAIPSKYVKAIAEDKDGTLWIATDNGICTLKDTDKKTGIFNTYPYNAKKSTSLPSNYVKSIAIDEEQTIWIGSDGGVSKLIQANKAAGIFQTFAHDAKNTYSLGNNYVKNIYFDSKGNLWACADAGVARLTKDNRNTGLFNNFNHNSGDLTSLSSIYSKSVFEDKSGQIWVSTDGGISKFDPQRERFELYQHNPSLPSLPSNSIRAISQSANKTIWVGSEKGLIKWENGIFTTFVNKPAVPNSLVNDYINHILETQNGELWVATDGGVSVMQANGKSFKNFVHNDKPTSICSNTINHVFEDKNGILWFATWDGMARLDKNNRKEGIFYNYPQDKYGTTGNRQVQHIMEDSLGTLWFATKAGLLKYLEKEDKFIAYTYNNKDSTSINTYEVNVLYELNGKGLWIGTLGGGLNYFDKSSQKFAHFTENDGLISNFIVGILADAQGNLWLSSTKGLTKFTPPKNPFDKKDKGIFKNFTEKDGLQGNEFHLHAACNTQEGKFYFGGIHGITAFFPEDIKDENHDLPIYITDFKLFNKSVKVGIGKSSLLTKSITETKELKLSYLDNFFSFDFTALNYRNTEKNIYAYKMEGFDTDWIYVTANKRFATYTNLSSGDYTFRVKSANSLGIWNQSGISLKITIEPPIWERWWFRLLAVIIVVSGMVGMYQYRVNQIEAQKKELEKQVKIRTAEVVRQKEEIEAQNHLLEEQKQEILVQNEELTQQQEEIMSQRDNIEAKNAVLSQQKSEIEKSYHSISTLSEIGQKITSSLNMDSLIATVYESVNSLMNAAAFGIGIYEEDKQIISFSGFIENNEVIEYHEYSLTDTESLPIYCLLNREEILVNNLAKDIYNYLPHYSKDLITSYGNIPESLIYLPLLLENKVTGVITVQAFQKDAYNSNDIAILKTLASYIAIALDNAKAYTQIAKTQEALAEQNKHIMDSIRYGETIQKAMLPHEKDLQANFHSYFIVYKPKDVVSGDFYWFSKEADMKFLAVVDCTGHGVPGAFMSMIGISLLHEAINQQNIYSPAAVLEYLHQEIRTALKQDETTNRDGMDVCLCKISDKPSNNQLIITYGGAKRPLFYTDKGELKELKGNRKNIGGRTKDKIEAVFEEETITIDEGEMLYLSTDGFADQANDKRDKFSILHFKNLLQQIFDNECNEQKNIMVEALKNHQQQAEQRDDISVIGVRL